VEQKKNNKPKFQRHHYALRIKTFLCTEAIFLVHAALDCTQQAVGPYNRCFGRIEFPTTVVVDKTKTRIHEPRDSYLKIIIIALHGSVTRFTAPSLEGKRPTKQK